MKTQGLSIRSRLLKRTCYLLSPYQCGISADSGYNFNNEIEMSTIIVTNYMYHLTHVTLEATRHRSATVKLNRIIISS